MQDVFMNFTSSDIQKTTQHLGQIVSYEGDNMPIGFLPCDGRMLRRKNHEKLFKIIRTKYGDADGSNTAFNLPHMTSEEQGLRYIICVKPSK